ncbi:MAG: chorismate synthase [Bacteroidales bacterium]|nr:chorismate synthase [Bacteroidales bacterium]
MMTFGRIFKVSVFGESHGLAVGVVIDGVPAGLAISAEDFKADLDRRRSGAPGTTPRKEADAPEFLSGVFEGHTTGSPLTIVFRNCDTRPEDYASFRKEPRPGHADYVADIKFGGFNDPRGGGHFSGRLTLPVVAAGVVAKKFLAAALEDQFSIETSLKELGGSADPEAWDGLIAAAAAEGDSLGGVVECCVGWLPVGLGEPFWDSVESLVSHAVFAIPGVRGIEFGDGFAAAAMKGSEHNDPFPLTPSKNGAGGVNGGITNGNPLVFRVAFKPASSIRKGGVPGRHDVCIALRAPVVVEAVTSIVLADFLRLI